MRIASFSVLDAARYGNVTRFINHLPESICNLKVKETKTFKGKFLIFYAKKNISKNSELFFDYGKEYSLDWKNAFDEKIKKY